jgi:hypothetical protein
MNTIDKRCGCSSEIFKVEQALRFKTLARFTAFDQILSLLTAIHLERIGGLVIESYFIDSCCGGSIQLV